VAEDADALFALLLWLLLWWPLLPKLMAGVVTVAAAATATAVALAAAG
jgi:hypothetical protein